MRKKQKRLIHSSDGKWYLADKAYWRGSQLVAHGKIIDVTESIQPHIAGNAEYMKRLEAALVHKIKECYQIRGLTPTDGEVLEELKRLTEKVK